MKYFNFNKKKKKYEDINILIIIGALTLGLILLILKLLCKINSLKKNSDEFYMTSSTKKEVIDEVFDDLCISSVASNIDIDLSKAIASETPMNLCFKSISSSINVLVPEKWNVKQQGNNKKSVVVNNTVFDSDNYEAPLLFINYDLKKGSVLRIDSDKGNQ